MNITYKNARYYRWLFLGVAGLLAGAVVLNAQRSTNASRSTSGRRVKGFSIPDYYKGQPGQTNWLKSLLTGAEAQYQSSNQIHLQGLRVFLYRPDRQTNLVVEAPECIYDPKAETAQSDRDLQARSGDARLTIEGKGFTWFQTNSSLVISNQTHTVIHQAQPINIHANQLTYDGSTNRVEYRGRVHVEDAQLDMTSDLLSIQLREGKDRLESGTADRNVVILNKEDNSQATGNHAVYQGTSEKDSVELTGYPSWRRGLREGKGDRLRFERQNRAFAAFVAEGNTYTKIPRNELSLSGAFMPLGVPALANNQSNSVSQFIEVFADRAELRPNGGQFQGGVTVKDTPPVGPPGTAKCGNLVLLSGVKESKRAGPNATSLGDFADPPSLSATNQLDYLMMEDHVILEQGDQWVSGDKLVYATTNTFAVITGQPAWRIGLQEGSADILLFKPQTRGLIARTNAMMKLNAGAGSQEVWSMFGTTTNSPGATNRFLTITSREYEYQPGMAMFRDQVKATAFEGEHPSGQVTCDQMQVQLSLLDNKIEKLLADHHVVFERGLAGITNGPNAYQKLTCDRMTAQANKGAVESMVAEGQVDFQQGDLHGVCQQAVYFLKTDTFVLMGNTQVTNAQMHFSGPAFIVDRQQNRFYARTGWAFAGRIKSHGPAK